MENNIRKNVPTCSTLKEIKEKIEQMKAVHLCYGCSQASPLFERLNQHTQEQDVRHLEVRLPCQLQDQ